MDDSQILDWIENNMQGFRENIRDVADPQRFTMTFIDPDGCTMGVHGINLRDCVRGAVVNDRVMPHVRIL